MNTKITSLCFGLLICAASLGCEVAHAAQAATPTLAAESALVSGALTSTAAPGRNPPAPHSGSPVANAPSLQCVQVNSVGFNSCKDAGGYDSTCAVAKCGAGYTLTGGGGSCSAGKNTIKSLNPNVSTGQFGIMCEKQGIKPRANAVCCKL